MADGYRFDILEKRAERKAHLDDIGVATLPDQPGKRGYSAAESKMHFKAPVDYLFSLLCGCMEEVGSEFDGYAPLSGADFTGDVTIGGSLSVSGGIACDGSSVLFEKDISELRATVARHENNLYVYISHSDEEGALVATEIIKGVSPDKGDDGDALATTEWTNGAIAEEASIREAKDNDLESSIEALRKDFDDLKSIVYGIHSLTYNSYEFPYLTSSIIPEEVDGRKVVGGSYAIMDWVGGNSVSFNQLANRYSLYTPNGLTIAQSGNGRFVLNGTTTALTTIYFILTTTQNHKYLLKTNQSAPTDYSKFRYRINNVYVYDSAILTPTTSGSVAIDIKEGVTFDNVEFVINIHDLTLMGLDNITSVDEFKALFPLDYYPYNSGEIKSTLLSKIESWGYNLFDEEWEQGYYNPNNGAIVSNANRIRSTNFVKVTAGKSYTLEATSGTSSSGFTILYYNENKELLDGDTAHNVTNGVSFALPNYVRYIKFYTSGTWYGGTYKNDICFHLTGSRTGYAPYVGKLGEINIPNAPLRLDGVNDIHNTLTFEEQEDGTYNAILTKKFDIVDLGTLDWSYDGDNTRFYSDVMPNIKICQYGSSNPAPNMICQRYETKNTYYLDVSGSNMLISTNNSSSAKRIFVKDTSYTVATAFKTAMSGVYLLYETATPTTETIATGLTFDQASFPMEKGGTIKAVYEGVPPIASIDFMTKGE